MKTLYIIRHAEAEDLYGQPDSFRPLTERGNLQALALGNHLGQLPTNWIVSPAVRTYSTAHALSTTQSHKPVLHLEKRIYNAELSDLLEVIELLPNDWNDVVLIGHNPGVSNLSQFLTGMQHPFKKGAVVKIQLEITNWSEVAQACGKEDFYWFP
jgi:phosphohistidine phosphatase